MTESNDETTTTDAPEETGPPAPEPGSAEAMAMGHALAQGFVHGAKTPSLVAKPSEQPATPGEYKLVAKVWNELKAEVGKPATFVRHHRGAIVNLDAYHAERLLRAGAVVPTTAEQAEAPAAQSQSPTDKAVGIAAGAGINQPVDEVSAESLQAS